VLITVHYTQYREVNTVKNNFCIFHDPSNSFPVCDPTWVQYTGLTGRIWISPRHLHRNCTMHINTGFSELSSGRINNTQQGTGCITTWNWARIVHSVQSLGGKQKIWVVSSIWEFFLSLLLHPQGLWDSMGTKGFLHGHKVGKTWR